MIVDKKLYSLRQYDLDQVLRVERGSLLSVPRRGTPRSVIYNYTLIFQAVNLMKTRYVENFSVWRPASAQNRGILDSNYRSKRSGLNAG